MKTLIAIVGLVLSFQQTANAEDKTGLSPNICTCVQSAAPLLFSLEVYNAQGYPTQTQVYGPYTAELCQQAAQLLCK